MQRITEADARARVTLATAIDAIEQIFLDIQSGQARNLPVVRQPLANGMGVFGVKAGELMRHGVVGLKAGGYWPGNVHRTERLTNHQSTTLVFAADSGVCLAMVEANWLTEARTAAAGAVGIKALARPDSRCVGIIGTGVQARSQIEAALLVRSIDTVMIHGQDGEGVRNLGAELRGAHPALTVESPGLEDTVRKSDVLITVTPSAEALFPAEWSPPGQHINAMGADTAGKQELDIALLGRAGLFYDDRQQSLSIGEFQRLVASQLQERPLASVLAGRCPGRTGADELTIFDSSGIAVQDLAIAWAAISAQATFG
jgi:ornithine cyclodeaminase/alanine dehydrogenase-like protein (mu-crystallin family)